MSNWLTRLAAAGRARASSQAPLGAPEGKRSAAGGLAAVSAGGRPQWTPQDYAALAREGFAHNPVAYRCVRMVAEAAASVPLLVVHEGRRAADHPLQRLLDRPNPDQAGMDLREGFFGALQCSGNGYLEAAGGEDGGAPTELYALRPDRMRVVPGARGWAEAYEYRVGDRAVRLHRGADGFLPVLHLRLYNPVDDHYGFSPLAAAAASVDVHNASAAWNKALLDNAARPSGALVVSGAERLTAAQFDSLKTQLREMHSGAAGAGRPLLLEGGLDWKPMAMTPADMDFISGKHAAAREIALAFGVPPQLLGIPGDATYSNYREANAAFWRHTVAPLAERAARALTAWLDDRFPGCAVRCDLDAVPALSGERDALWARLEAASFLTPAERRRLAGLEDLPRGATGGEAETEGADERG